MAAPPCTNSDVIKAMDILCGRTKFCTDHVGSIAYKAILETKLPRYMDPNTESCDKTSMTIELVEEITAGGGRFLRERKTGSNVWEVLCKFGAREKIRDGLRDAVKSARKNKGKVATNPYLTKMGLSLEVTEKTSFAELVSRISEDPVMKQILIESKIRQGAMDRIKQKRIASHNASRKLSASTAKSSSKYSQMFAQQCSSSPVGNFVPIMPAAQQFVQVQLPRPQQPLLPKLSAVPTLRMHMELNNGHVMTEKEKSALSIQQAFCPVPSFPFPDYRNLLSMSSSRSMLINDDPWGEGDFEKVADPRGGYYVLEALQQADKLTDSPSNPQETADDKDKNMLDHIDEEARSDGDDLLEAFERVDELVEAINLPVTTQEAGLDNNKNTRSSNDEDDFPEALERPYDYFEAASAEDLPSDQEASSDHEDTAGTSKPSSGAYKRMSTRTAWSTWLTVKRQRRIHQEEPIV